MKRIKISRYADFGKYTKREKMVKVLRDYGIRDRRVLDVFLTIPRHCFLPEGSEALAYRDQPAGIGCGQTISQPYVIALMLEALELKPQHRVLEIGSGCGYVLALLSVLVRQAYGVEIEKVLAEKSRKTLKWLNIHNAEVVCGDGYEGYSAGAPYDAILLSAAPDKLPETLFTQLRSGGKMVLPVGKFNQLLELYEKKAGKWQRKVLTEVRFVPLRKKQ